MTDQPITKETLDYLAKLARIDLTPEEEKRFLKELQNIVHHVAELQSVNTEGIAPMNGGGALETIFRDDAERFGTNQGEGPEQFPNKENGFLKVPPIFGS